MMRALLVPISLCALVAACGDSPTSNSPRAGDLPSLSTAATAPSVNPIVQWNRVLLQIVRTPGAQPATIHPTRSFAMMHVAIYDAVNAIERTHRPYMARLPEASPSASQDAAASSAAHDVLVALYPSLRAQLDDQLRQLLAQVPDGPQKTDGIQIGEHVADRILTLRRHDGSDAPPTPFVFHHRPGDYQSTPPNFPAQPQFTQWSRVAPFALERASQFRLAPPPALGSDAYGRALNEVKSLGVANGTAASADQALSGQFWNGAIQNFWNEIAQTASLAHHLTTAQNARLFALLNLTLADCVIAFYDSKYTYALWRPVTAIRAADTDHNANTAADPNWLPEVGNTTPDPSYPGAHAVISAAGAVVLQFFFGSDRLDFSVTSEVLPGVERSFHTLSGAAREASLSRIFAGVHFRFDLIKGERLGREVAHFVTGRFLTPVSHPNVVAQEHSNGR